jgi:ribosomal protein S18 acetylase RimI-like enzyme
MPGLERGEPKVRIRPMADEDVDSVLAIDRKITGKRRAVTYTEMITGDLGGVLALSLVAEVNGEVKGFILARRVYVGEPPIEVGLIQILGVDPGYQRQGIASKMVNAFLDACRFKKLHAVRIMINERDSQLQGLFEHLGFRRGELIDYTKSL